MSTAFSMLIAYLLSFDVSSCNVDVKSLPDFLTLIHSQVSPTDFSFFCVSPTDFVDFDPPIEIFSDCGWQGTERNSTGGFTWSTTAIPDGIPALVDFVHNLGLKFGVYSDGGFFACDSVGGTAHFLGSLGFETEDAETFAQWGSDYLKYESCYLFRNKILRTRERLCPQIRQFAMRFDIFILSSGMK
ncbi:glycoside hydrolase [Gymnopus androsaceus JB14]|uniref:alpha-galactosidase n=1 Tax=Gymnopus androsaceus JB14 TaxID=1447944 RepID=A0A6A4HZQ2_9AGAR|nr:glycoside hydrolase [Gymnopus androsaceus JB14]